MDPDTERSAGMADDGGDMDIGDNAAASGTQFAPPPPLSIDRLLELEQQSAELTMEDRWHTFHHVLQTLVPHLDAAVTIARLRLRLQELSGGDGDGGFGAAVVPASAAAKAELEKQTFHAAGECGGVTECAICLEGFEDGEEVTVMPCFHGHEFHPDCIAKWLGRSNRCPICRHQLPTGVDG